MSQIWLYTLGSVLVVSLVSLVGVFTLAMQSKVLNKLLMYMVSFSAGALLGDSFIHLLPEIAEEVGFTFEVSLSVLFGVVLFFAFEKLIRFRHCHHVPERTHKKDCNHGCGADDHVHPFALINLIGDSLHNFIDGLIIGASYLVSIEVGVATTIAVVFHEIPQEIGDFCILIHGGYSKARALFLNFVTAAVSFLGAACALILNQRVEGLTEFIIPFAAGGFIYIACSDLIPELHKEVRLSRSMGQFVLFLGGIGVMLLLLEVG